MKKGKLLTIVCLLVVSVMFAIAQTAYAVDPINLDGFEDMPTSTGNTTKTENTTNNVTANNTGSEAKTNMPQTGSNALTIFVSGMAVLTVASIVIFKKFANIKLN